MSSGATSAVSAEDYQYLLQSFKDELLILGRVMYKVKNQQRRNESFKHLEGVMRFSKQLFKST